MKLLNFLFFGLLISSCQNSYKKNCQYLLSTDTIKYWDAMNGKGAWGCVAYTKHGAWRTYYYNHSRELRVMEDGDVVRDHTYKFINDSLLYEGHSYLLIKKLTNDTLIISQIMFPEKEDMLYIRKKDKVIFEKGSVSIY